MVFKSIYYSQGGASGSGGGGGSGISTINGNTGSVTGSIVTITTGSFPGTLTFSGSASTLTLNASETTYYNTGIGGGNLVNTVANGGQRNVALGYNAANGLTTGSYNVALGMSALNQGTGNSYCTVVGFQSGFNYTGSESSNILIGYNILGTTGESNVLRIGNATGTSIGNLNSAYIQGIYGVSPSSPQMVTINSSGQLGSQALPPAAFAWNFVSTNQTGAVNNGYVFTSGGALTISLPATSAQGSIIEVLLAGATSWQITQGAGQQIQVGQTLSTAGVGGSVISTAQGDSLRLICTVTNLSWVALSAIGNPTIV